MQVLLIFYQVIACLVICSLTALTCCIVSGEKLVLRTFMKVFAILGSILILNMFILSTDSPYRMVFAIAGALLCYFLVYQFRGRRLLLYSFLLIFFEFSGDILTGMIFFQLFSSETIAGMRYMTNAGTIFLQAACGGMMVFFACIYRMLHAHLHHIRINANLGYLLRPVGMLSIICFIFAKTLHSTTLTDQIARFRQILPDLLIMALLLLIGASYMMQDIRSYQQALENKSLMHQQSLQSLLLQDTREFRHNISNMIYGFQGILLSGDLSAIESYYDHMAASCQMINNENVVALKRLPSQAVSTLVLHKIHQANAERIPFYATVSEDILWGGMRDEEMTQVLGVLLDNALEATRLSQAPFVSFEAKNTKDAALCITIRNTFNFSEQPSFNASTKPGHEGLGLESVRRIVKKHSNVLFNIYTRGRYVEVSLMCYER